MTADKAALLCERCGGEGQLYTSRYGGNDPDVWPVGECPVCEGTGYEPIEDDPCADACQYAKDVAMPEYSCANGCMYRKVTDHA